jgi:hypothetical protein
MHGHRKDSNQDKCKNYKLYQEMRRLGQQAFNIELIENYPCASKGEINKREGYWIRELKATLNKQIAGRTPKEYRNENKEQILETKKEYYSKNIDKIKEQKKEYYKQNQEQKKELVKSYYKQNADQIKEYQKEYRRKNADALKEGYSKEHMCPVCWGTYTGWSKLRHERTQKHIKAIETQGQGD